MTPETWALLGMLCCLGLGYVLGRASRQREIASLRLEAEFWRDAWKRSSEVAASKPFDLYAQYRALHTAWEAAQDAEVVERLLREL